MKDLRIDRSHLENIANRYRAQENELRGSKDKKPEPQKDQVILSKEAKELQAATQDIEYGKSLSKDRTGRIQEVKILIERGQYQVDSKVVAAKMIARALGKERM